MLRRCLLRPQSSHPGLNISHCSQRARYASQKPASNPPPKPISRAPPPTVRYGPKNAEPGTPEPAEQPTARPTETSRQKLIRYLFKPWAAGAATAQRPRGPNIYGRVIAGIIAAPLLYHIFANYFFAWEGAWGISMLPTIAASGEWLLLSKAYRHGRNCVVGDIVSFRHPIIEGEYAVKRILGMPGDYVLAGTPGKGKGSMLQVPEGHCWVIGDNLTWSRDSRMFGPLPLALVNAKVTWRMPSFWSLVRAENTMRDAEDVDLVVE